ncbi:FAD-dependent monooxygenase [Rhizobium sp. SGZ-381]|uniref:FAD-dependent monooxygenase n=1 Tax=Rhizobium sp. SGZ-381 TaxID=3342800 RepID=UPI00366F605B
MAITHAVIVGAGMAGLTTALALAARGIRSDIIEQAPHLAEVGAGLQISPNASRILARLGVLADLEAVWTEPERIAISSGKSLRQLAHVPAGRFARERWRAPYGVMHRATLQRGLQAAVDKNPLCRLHLGIRIGADWRQSIASVVGATPDVTIGADGVWSRMREEIANAPEPDFSRNVAWRFTVPTEKAPAFLMPQAVTAYVGPSCHLVCYPLREAGGFNVVAIASGVSPGETWEVHASLEQKRMLLRQFKGWHPQILSLLTGMESGKFWPLYQVSDGRWHNGRDVVLVGDAAHAMMPFAAQGAAMAIEDGWELAARLAMTPVLADALSTYESVRRARIARVRNRGAFNRFAYHVRGPLRLGRDMVLALRPPQALAADLDWLYGYDAGL